MNARVLVLGGSGFIGSHLVDALVKHGAHVRVLSRHPSSHCPPIPGVEYHYADFTDITSVSESLFDVDIVFHLISTTIPATAHLDPIADINGNLLPTVRMLQLLRDVGVNRLIFLSSGGTVYGNSTSALIREDIERNPLSSYGIVKVAIENYIAMFSSQHGLKSLVLRVSNPYGPRQSRPGIHGVIPTFFQRILAGEEIRIWGDGSNVRDYLYISDLITALLKCVENDVSGVYNLGSGQGTALTEVLSIIEEVSGRRANVRFLPPREFDVDKIVLDISRLRSALDWSPLISLREGCARYWNWTTGGSSH